MAEELKPFSAKSNPSVFGRLACGFLGGAITGFLVCFLGCLLFAVTRSVTSLLPFLCIIVVFGILGMIAESVVVFRESKRTILHLGWRLMPGRRISGALVWALSECALGLAPFLDDSFPSELKAGYIANVIGNAFPFAFLGYISSMISLRVRRQILKEPRIGATALTKKAGEEKNSFDAE